MFDIIVNIGVPILGIVIASRRPENAIGWLLLAAGLALGLTGFSRAYGSTCWSQSPGLTSGRTGRGVDRERTLADPGGHAPLPLPALPDWTSVVASVEAGAMVRDRVARTVLVGTVVFATSVWNEPFTLADTARSGGSFALTLFVVVPFLQPIAAGVSFVSVAVRYRGSVGDERHPAQVVRDGRVVRPPDVHGHAGDEPSRSRRSRSTSRWCSLYVAIGVAILKAPALRHRCHHQQGASCYGILGAFITVVYVAIVVVVGAFIGATQFLSLVATARIVAIAFQPARDRAKRTANRVIYGKRATPYEVLSGFSERVSETYGGEHILPRMARLWPRGLALPMPPCGCGVDDEMRPPPHGRCPPSRGRPSRRTTIGLPAFPDVDAAGRRSPRSDLLEAAHASRSRPAIRSSAEEDKLLA